MSRSNLHGSDRWFSVVIKQNLKDYEIKSNRHTQECGIQLLWHINSKSMGFCLLKVIVNIGVISSPNLVY